MNIMIYCHIRSIDEFCGDGEDRKYIGMGNDIAKASIQNIIRVKELRFINPSHFNIMYGEVDSYQVFLSK